jgi:hypothetical protein
MQVEKDRSLTSIYDYDNLEHQRKRLAEQLLQETGLQDGGASFEHDQLNSLMVPSIDQVPKGIQESRVSGDLVFTDDESDLFEGDEEARKAAEIKKRENIQSWIKDSTD